MKKNLLLGVSLLAYGIQAQVGINTDVPKAMLDVNGDARIQQVEKIGLQDNRIVDEALKKYDDCPCLLIIENDGKVRRIAISETNLGRGEGSGNSGNQGGEVSSIANLGNAASATIEDQVVYITSLIYEGGEHQGVIDNTQNKFLIKIPYSNGNGKAYNSAVSNATTVGTATENGVFSGISMAIKEGTLANNEATAETTFLEAEITAPETINIKKLEAKETQKVADFKFVLGGQEHTVTLMAIGAIPDRNYGDRTHDFLYLPVKVANGKGYDKTWLNFNLGVAYAKVGSSDFNLDVDKKGASSDLHSDGKLYGSYFQWQRSADNHEFKGSESIQNIFAENWNGKTPDNIVGRFIYDTNGGANWVSGVESASGSELTLWKAPVNGNELAGKNNPCPLGFHVPTKDEWRSFHEAVTGQEFRSQNNKMWIQELLPNLPAAGYRNGANGSLEREGVNGSYWSSEQEGIVSSGGRLFFTKSISSTQSAKDRIFGMNIRCIKD